MSMQSKLYLTYTIDSNYVDRPYYAELWYSTTSETSGFVEGTPDETDPLHSGGSGLAIGEHCFVWDLETDLGSSYIGPVYVKLRVNRVFVSPLSGSEVKWSTVHTYDIILPPVAVVTAPVPGTYGTPVYVNYKLQSNLVLPMDVEVEFSLDGATYSTCSPLATDTLHEGITGLADGEHVFVWDALGDLGRTFSDDGLSIRVRAYDGEQYGEYSYTREFAANMLPSAPTIVNPAEQAFDHDMEVDFTWLIPGNPGPDRIAFQLDIAADQLFSTVELTQDSETYPDRFMHQITEAIGSHSSQMSEVAYVVRGLEVTSTTATEVLWSSLYDRHTGLPLPGTLADHQILLLNRADRRAYIPSITSTGFTIAKAGYGLDDDALVDLIIFAPDEETYWVDLTVTGTTSYTLGSAPFATDLFSRTIPASIAGLSPEILERSDAGVYVTSRSDSGFTLNLVSGHISDSATVRVCLRAHPEYCYQHRDFTASSYSNSTVMFSASLDDYLSSNANWPDYLPGTFMTTTLTADRGLVISRACNDSIIYQMSGFGVADQAQADLMAMGGNDSQAPYYTDIPPTGVPDSYEGSLARYTKEPTFDPSAGTYYWRVTGANLT